MSYSRVADKEALTLAPTPPPHQANQNKKAPQKRLSSRLNALESWKPSDDAGVRNLPRAPAGGAGAGAGAGAGSGTVTKGPDFPQ
jgi:hypothetical protein